MSNLVQSLKNYVDLSEDQINDLISTMDFRDLVNLNTALKDDDRDLVLEILHGYGI